MHTINKGKKERKREREIEFEPDPAKSQSNYAQTIEPVRNSCKGLEHHPCPWLEACWDETQWPGFQGAFCIVHPNKQQQIVTQHEEQQQQHEEQQEQQHGQQQAAEPHSTKNNERTETETETGTY